MADINPIQPVASGIQPVRPMSLAEMVQLAGGMQQYQQAQQINPLRLQEAQLQLQRLQQLTPEEIKRAQAEARVSAETVEPRISAAQTTAETGKTTLASTQMDFANKQVNAIANRLTGLINNPLIVTAEQNPQAINPDQLTGVIKKYAEEQAIALGIPKEKADQLIAPYLEQTKNPAGVRQFLKDKLLATLDQGSRVTALQPSGTPISTGTGGYQVSGTEFGAVRPGGILPGTVYEQQLPPATEVVDPLTGQKKLLGPVSQRQENQLTTNVAPQQAGVLAAQSTILGEDLNKTIAAAQQAPTRIALFQNIKKLAPDSFTGPTAERRQLVTNFAQMLGLDVGKLETASTDELMKNTALLQMAGGNTDAARNLAMFANPNNKMSKEGILRVADQLIGIEKMNLARANYLTPVQNDAAQYAQRMNNFTSIADPRLFQEMNREDVIKLRKSMSPAEQARIDAMVKKARAMGVLQ